MRRKPDTFTMVGADVRALTGDAHMHMFFLAGYFALVGLLIFNVIRAGMYRLPENWATAVLLGVCIAMFMGCAAVSVRTILRCRAAPHRLVGAVGIRARVDYYGGWSRGSLTQPVRFTTASGQSITMDSRSYQDELEEGCVGTLYRNGRTAAFRTKTETHWAL